MGLIWNFEVIPDLSSTRGLVVSTAIEGYPAISK
jgi:hypothetical protein